MIQTWLAFDIGTTGTKAALIGSDGHTIRSAYRAYDTVTADGGLVEQQAANWWQAVVESVRELAAGDVDALAITGQMQDLILLDRTGEPVRPVILYSDTRAYQEAAEVNARLGADRLRQLTGNGQEAGSLLAKLLWLSRHEPESLTRSARLLTGAADYVALKLTGQALTDSTTDSTTGLLDINTREMLARDLFTALGLADVYRLLPPVSPGGTLAGPLDADAARLLGLKPGLPVYHGPGDAGATTLGAGSGEPGNVYAYIGTSGWVAFTSSQRVTRAAGIFTLAHPSADRYIYVAPLLTAGGNLDWARDLFDIADYGDLIGAALDQPPTSLLYLPYLNGERSPFSDPFARGAFIGISARHTRADLCRAVLEGVIFAYRHALETLVDAPPSLLTLTGGGTRSRAWCQLFADITHTLVTIAEDAAHVGVRGAVLAAQVTAGQMADYYPADFFPSAGSLKPDRRLDEHYDRQYELFKVTYPALKDIFARMR